MKFAFISTMTTVPWGGSETLWHGTALNLRAQGHSVHALRRRFDPVPSPVVALVKAGIGVSYPQSGTSLLNRLVNRIAPKSLRRTRQNPAANWLESIEPSGVFISCGSLLDDLSGLVHLTDSTLPFAIVIHAAAPEIWPPDHAITDAVKLLSAARCVFFVSQHNCSDVQLCLGITLPNADIVRCPLNLSPALRALVAVPPLPSTDGLKLACVARLNVPAKGQDVLIRTLALEKWKSRDVSLTLYGEGPHRRALENAARHLGVSRVTFAGQIGDISTIWREHHLGVLASRFEGLPLSLLEAMMLGRANVVTRVCGNPEVVEDNVTGFLAAAPTVEAFDEALERAWSRRADLGTMGIAAARSIRQLVPADPCADLANRLVKLF